MGVSNGPVPTAVVSLEAPEVAVSEAESGETEVMLSGTMYHDGLNANAWGLTESGAREVADDLVGADLTASHPRIRGSIYDRSMAGGQGAPIGRVVDTNVTEVEEAALEDGGYTAEYTAQVTDPTFKQRYAAGVYDGEEYSVSIGIYGDPEAASCSVCGEAMAGDDCGHDRFDEVEVEGEDGETETKVAGPLYDSADADHLAAVYVAAYDGATADVTASAIEPEAANTREEGGDVPMAADVLGAAHDAGATEAAADEPEETAERTDDRPTYPVRTASTERDSYRVTLNDD